MHLYGDHLWESPWFFTAFVALREKGLPFELTTFNLGAGEHRREPFLSRALTGKIPALDHDGFWLTESAAIVEYLDEALPSPRFPRLLPSSIDARARARQALSWLRTDLLALRRERPTSSMFFSRATEPLSAAAEADLTRLLRIAGRLITPGAPHLFGEWSVADADLAFCLHRVILNGHDVPAAIRTFAETAWRRPSVHEFVTHARPAR